MYLMLSEITAIMGGFTGFLQPVAVYFQQSWRKTDHASRAIAEVSG